MIMGEEYLTINGCFKREKGTIIMLSKNKQSIFILFHVNNTRLKAQIIVE